MKTTNILSVVLFCFIFGSVNAQDKKVKAQLANKAEQSEIDILLNSKSFEFIANTALPLGQPPRNLVGSNYSVTFSPDLIISNMPFYGRSYSTTMVSGRDKGMRFKDAPEIFTVEKQGKGFEVRAKVKNDNETYTVLLIVSASGYATLSITTNDRQIMDYQGEVVSIRE
ncbi:DUF4251 domain-containing protein [Aequorivita lipolytica]|uniref:DUF4251 domain-containing protein n=1 Tax=Aequorivita lipolytica TaxID=153267 RepID=A0A5C6YVK8_9FLAO|nr:DUF4251 domain-containing protein [Aequorivita lipolytica]TXD70963.1 DUF4251 domain-containing protein [Aequorivita lipolytica]SRX50018.1 hypothetical protein AEQU2_00484 [Aequorivita lipolytica]